MKPALQIGIRAAFANCDTALAPSTAKRKKTRRIVPPGLFIGNTMGLPRSDQNDSVQWNCSSSVEPVSALTLLDPPWITVVTSSK